MAPKGVEMGIVMILVAMLWNGAAGQSGCTKVLMGLSPCLNFVTGNSSTPSSSCCSQLSNVVQSQPRCLCSMLNGGGASLGVNINQTLALTLPGACNVQTPAVSQCNAAASGPTASAATPASAPVGSPADSIPSDSSDETPETPTTSSESNNPSAGTGSKTFPSTDGTSSGGSIIRSPLQVALFLLFIISSASTATLF
ncbi:hypothetical protein Acr_13g0002090 [Actinidia rufa]|uniref:Bifunctional inhibitor/plant lipid transfer protein/seed storage helical domain-containing protein n=1 Tax=Actinidia rufa TaxID=165716 RepID=A0A7J0FJC9_9ERIC|nr:hypothetical protein Acr_13g0002090 [Actinidia rufa]